MTTLPGPTVGVVGAGQLGRMLGEAAAPMGIDIVASDPSEDAPASPVVEQIVGDFDDRETYFELAERADVLTYEIELVDPDALEAVIEETGTPVHPHPSTLRTIADKLVQKQTLQEAGIPVPRFRAVSGIGEVVDAAEEFGYPMMLKARVGGYDGRGNAGIYDRHDVESALEVVEGPCMVEEFVDYERELAIMGVKGDDEIDTFPVTETIHEEEILRGSVSPPRTDDDAVLERAREVAHDVLEVMEGRGVYGIELFETTDGEILLNEIAPRPHNSGHWTIEGCATSQFEQHLRAVLGWPLGSTERRSPTVSANILGDVSERQPATLRNVDRVLETDGCKLHWYGKDEVYHLRKMGHFTQIGDADADLDEMLEESRAIRDELTFESG